MFSSLHGTLIFILLKSNITFELFYKQAMIVIYQHTDTKCIADNTFPSKQHEIKYINKGKKKVSTMRIYV